MATSETDAPPETPAAWRARVARLALACAEGDCACGTRPGMPADRLFLVRHRRDPDGGGGHAAWDADDRADFAFDVLAFLGRLQAEAGPCGVEYLQLLGAGGAGGDDGSPTELAVFLKRSPEQGGGTCWLSVGDGDAPVSAAPAAGPPQATPGLALWPSVPWAGTAAPAVPLPQQVAGWPADWLYWQQVVQSLAGQPLGPPQTHQTPGGDAGACPRLHAYDAVPSAN